MKRTNGHAAGDGGDLHTLAIDIGGTGLKASVLDGSGKMIADRIRIPTPYPCTPPVLVEALTSLVAPLPEAARVSVGFPGVIRRGHIITAPHFGTEIWHGYPLEAALAKALGKPVRLLNDAEVQGLGIITGRGLEVVLTLGTGVGTAVFRDGVLMPHLELSQHPLHNGETYNDYLGDVARRKHGARKWSRRVVRTIPVVRTLLNYEVLYLGGGNAAKLKADPGAGVKIASNDAGITGGVHLWDRVLDPIFKSTDRERPKPSRLPPDAADRPSP